MKKSVFITGSTYGTGYGIAEVFASNGYDVFIGSRRLEESEEAAARLSEKYGIFSKGYVYQTTTLDEAEVKGIFDDIRSEGYLLDAIVFNAANLGIGQVSLEVDINDFMGVYTTNIGWNFLMAREAAKQMKEKGGGAIVFIGSNSAQRVTEGGTKTTLQGLNDKFTMRAVFTQIDGFNLGLFNLNHSKNLLLIR